MTLNSSQKDANGADSRSEGRQPPNPPSRRPTDYVNDFPVPGAFEGKIEFCVEPESLIAIEAPALSGPSDLQDNSDEANVVSKTRNEDNSNKSSRRPPKLSRKGKETEDRAGPGPSSTARNIPLLHDPEHQQLAREKKALESDYHWYGNQPPAKHWVKENTIRNAWHLDEKAPWAWQYHAAFERLSAFYNVFEDALAMYGKLITHSLWIQTEKEMSQRSEERVSKWKRKADQPKPHEAAPSESMVRLIEAVASLDDFNRRLNLVITKFEVMERFLSDELWKVPSHRGLMKSCRLIIDHGERIKWKSTGSKQIDLKSKPVDIEDLSVEADNYKLLHNAYMGNGCAGWKTCLEDAEYALRQWSNMGTSRFAWQNGSWRLVS